jgi:phage replication-related protein YjqB (UPF0714/DUF867 family)
MDTYTSYRDLAAQEEEGRDFEVIVRKGGSRVAVVAIHAGAIEPGTAEIAEGIAGQDHALYCFRGIKPANNRTLHLTAKRFDEPRGRGLVETADTVIAIHGCRGDRTEVYVGGRDLELRREIRRALVKAGFTARESFRPGLRGTHPGNICNRSVSGRGVQLEISEGLRRGMFDLLERRQGRKRTPAYFRFINAVREAIEKSASCRLPNGLPERGR